jgi:hypothetical protein
MRAFFLLVPVALAGCAPSAAPSPAAVPPPAEVRDVPSGAPSAAPGSAASAPPVVAAPTIAPADAGVPVANACGRTRADTEGRTCDLWGATDCKLAGASCRCAGEPAPCQGAPTLPTVAPRWGTWRCFASDGGMAPVGPTRVDEPCTRP